MKFKEKPLCFNAIGFGSGSSKLLNLSKIILNNISVVSIKALLILRRIFEFCLKREIHINNEIILLIIVYPREILPNSSFWLLSWHMYHSLVTACIFLARFFSCQSMNIWEGFLLHINWSFVSPVFLMYSVLSMGEITTCILYACMQGKQHYFISIPRPYFLVHVN